MDTEVAFAESAISNPYRSGRCLFVAWQNPETRSITPVARLNVGDCGGGNAFEFRYLARASDVLARPFISFPDFAEVYRAAELFPFFENRMVPLGRSDFGDWAANVGLPPDADPFEVLAGTGGYRATDTLEVFQEPTVDRSTRTASAHFLVRGVRHRAGANDLIDSLNIDDQLLVIPEPDNDFDPLALLVSPQSGEAIGWIPAYLCSPLHRSASASSWDDIAATVQHVGDRSGPPHFRVLCHLTFPWPFSDRPFDSPAFAIGPP